MIEAIVEELEPKRDALRRARADLPRRRRARDEHVGAVRDRDRRRDLDAGARRRHALLQPGAADAARRDRARRAHGDEAFETAFALGGADSARRPIRCHDTPGFVVNRVLIPLLNDCIRVLDEARVTPEDLDAAMKHGAGWPMGPCELVDLVGIDVHVHAARGALREAPRAADGAAAAARRDGERRACSAARAAAASTATTPSGTTRPAIERRHPGGAIELRSTR